METLKIEDNGRYYGVVGKNRTVIVPFEYDEIIRTFSSGLINVRKNDKWGCLDLEGNIVIPLEYDWIFPFGKDESSTSSAKRNGKWGIIDRKGNDIIPCIYDDEVVFNKDGAVVSLNGKIGKIDNGGKTVIPCQYTYFKPFVRSTKLIKVMEDGKWGVIDVSGNVMIPMLYDDIGELYMDYVVVKQNGFCGLVDLKGEVILPFEYDKIDRSIHGREFSEIGDKSEVFAVHINKKWEYIIVNSENKSKAQFDWISGPWRKNEYIVKIEKNYGIVNRVGEVIIPITYSKIFVNYDRVILSHYVLKNKGQKSTIIPFDQ